MSENNRGSDDSTSTDERLLRVERDVQARLGDRPLDFESLQVVANVYRAASAIRRRAERDVLGPNQLSFGGFTILWVLWIWGEMETAQLADECGIAKGTLTGMLTTLERRELVARERPASDRRRMMVTLTAAGTELIDDLFPRFNAFESEMASSLNSAEKASVAELLRRIITTAQEPDVD